MAWHTDQQREPLPLFDALWDIYMTDQEWPQELSVEPHLPQPRRSPAEVPPVAVAQEYRHTDPAPDENYPRISAYDPDHADDAFPVGWSGEPTERDQAAIDAGNS